MQKYLCVFRLAILLSIRNYKSFIGLSIFMIACILLFSQMWKVVSAKTTLTYTPQQLLWYLTFNEWILISMPRVQFNIEHDLRSGRLAYLLPRPISYLGSIFAEGAGTLLLNLIILGTVGFSFTWFCVGSVPLSPTAFLQAITLGFLAAFVWLIFQMLVGVSAFWLQEVWSFNWVWEKLLFVLGGLILPLSIYPPWLQTLASFTPFPSLLGQRSGLVFGNDTGDILWIIVTLSLWGIVSLTTLLYLYKKGLRILNIGGG